MAERKRTLKDKVISTTNSLRYALTEPAMLNIQRARYGIDYVYDKEPLISVYTPTYNRAKLLMSRAVKTVLNQTYKNIEYIIVGDYCTDETEELVSQIDDDRVRFVNLPEKPKNFPKTAECMWFAGPVRPANVALNMVKGQWIARIDDDDMFLPDHLESSLKFALDGGYEFVSAMYEEERDGIRKVMDEKDQNPRIGGAQTWLYRSYLRFFNYNQHCWRKSWDKVNDLDLQKRMYNAGVRIGFNEKVVAQVFPRPNETTIGLDAYKRAETEGFRRYYGTP